jgi:ubiquinone/menaquinone biosynthesis C-methylase UbiE
MAGPEIRFEDGAGYEQVMGRWSRIAGTIFLDWTAPPRGWRWLDVGCGNGAFTELLVERCAPTEVHGIDPSPAQLDYAKKRAAARLAQFQQGSALALPFERDRFDAATMALVIFFVPDPAKGVAEMARVVRPGGQVAAYAWDFPGGGFPYEAIRAEIAAAGVTPVAPPSADASRIEALRALWQAAGLEGVETREIAVERRFADFEEFWAAGLLSAGIRATLATMAPEAAATLKERVRERLPADAAGGITVGARANAVKGRVKE